MMKHASFVIWIFLVGGMVSCSPPPLPDSSHSASGETGQVETAMTTTTSTALPYGFQTQTPSVQVVYTLEPTLLGSMQTATLEAPLPTDLADSSGSLNLPQLPEKCDRAQAGSPIDISVPDDSAYQPGEQFTKIWRVVNSGSCAWSADYAVVWFSGDDLGQARTRSIGLVVQPGQSVELSVDMSAPHIPGVYQSNWKISNNQGGLFGIGPDGDAPFWVRIVVNPAYTPTPAATAIDPTAVPPPVILAQGQKTLLLDEGVDLNMWSNNPAVIEDLGLRLSDDAKTLTLAPLNGAGVLYYGAGRPSFAECLRSQVADVPLVLEDYPPGAYYCYRTADEMPGRLLLTSFDSHNSQLTLEYLTWIVP